MYTIEEIKEFLDQAVDKNFFAGADFCYPCKECELKDCRICFIKSLQKWKEGKR